VWPTDSCRRHRSPAVQPFEQHIAVLEFERACIVAVAVVDVAVDVVAVVVVVVAAVAVAVAVVVAAAVAAVAAVTHVERRFLDRAAAAVELLLDFAQEPTENIGDSKLLHKTSAGRDRISTIALTNPRLKDGLWDKVIEKKF